MWWYILIHFGFRTKSWANPQSVLYIYSICLYTVTSLFVEWCDVVGQHQMDRTPPLNYTPTPKSFDPKSHVVVGEKRNVVWYAGLNFCGKTWKNNRSHHRFRIEGISKCERLCIDSILWVFGLGPTHIMKHFFGWVPQPHTQTVGLWWEHFSSLESTLFGKFRRLRQKEAQQTQSTCEDNRHFLGVAKWTIYFNFCCLGLSSWFISPRFRSQRPTAAFERHTFLRVPSMEHGRIWAIPFAASWHDHLLSLIFAGKLTWRLGMFVHAFSSDLH